MSNQTTAGEWRIRCRNVWAKPHRATLARDDRLWAREADIGQKF